MTRPVRAVLVAVLLIAASATALPVASAASVPPATDEVHTCAPGERITTVIPGNLVVPAGVTCSMFYGAVRGTTTVAGNFTAVHATFKKTITVARGGELTVIKATMWGWVVLHGAAYLSMNDVTLVGSLVGSAAPPGPSYYAWITMTKAKIRGDVDIVGAGFERHMIELDHSTVNGSVSFQGSEFTQIGGQVLGGETIDAGRSARVCGTSVVGNLSLHGARAYDAARWTGVTLGSPFDECPGRTHVGGSVSIVDNSPMVVALDAVDIDGSLYCHHNPTLPTLTDVNVVGEREDACA